MSKIERILKIINDEIKICDESLSQSDKSEYFNKQIRLQRMVLTRLLHKINQVIQESPFSNEDIKEFNDELPTKYRTIMTKYRGGGFSIANQYYHEHSQTWKTVDNDHMSVSIHTPNQINNFIKTFNDTDKNNFGVDIVIDEWEISTDNKIKRGKKK